MAKQIIRLTESKLRQLVETCVKETIENMTNEGMMDDFKAWGRRTLNGKAVNNEAFDVQQLVRKYEKLYQQYGNSLPDVYKRKYQSELERLKRCAADAGRGYGKADGTINMIVKSLNNIIGQQEETDKINRQKAAAARPQGYNQFYDMEQRRKMQRGGGYDSKFDTESGAEVDSNGRY